MFQYLESDDDSGGDGDNDMYDDDNNNNNNGTLKSETKNGVITSDFQAVQTK